MDNIKSFNHTYNTDCFKGMNDLENSSFDYVFTSPPYNRKRNDKYTYYNDQIDWLKMLNSLVDDSFRVLKDSGYLILNIQKNYYNKRDYYTFIGQHYKEIVETIIWGKTNPMPASSKNITNSYEVFLIINKNGKSIKAQHTYTKNIFLTNVNSNNKYSKINKAVMNIDACRRMFKDYIGTNKKILDPFMGVGTTSLVCKEFNCPFIGFEINKECARISNYEYNRYKENNYEN